MLINLDLQRIVLNFVMLIPILSGSFRTYSKNWFWVGWSRRLVRINLLPGRRLSPSRIFI